MKIVRRLIRWTTVALLIGGWTAFASAVHVVRTPDVNNWPRATIVPKTRLGFAQTFVDVRHWTAADTAAHPDLAQRLIEAGKLDALPPDVAGGLGDLGSQAGKVRRTTHQASGVSTL